MTETLIKVEFIQGMLSGLSRKGLDTTPFLEHVGVAPAALAAADYPGLTPAQYIALFYRVVQELKDECLGLLSRPFKPGSFALTARVGMSAADLRSALRRMATAFNLLQDDMEFELVARDDEAGLLMHWIGPGEQAPPYLQGTLVQVFWRLAAWLIDGTLPIRHFDFTVVELPYMSAYAPLFSIPFRFEQASTGFWFDAATLQAPIVRDDMAMRAFLADSFGQIISPPRAMGPVTQAVRNYLLRSYPSWPDLPSVAKHLHVSRPTLQRQLAAEHSSLQGVKDNLRRDLSISRLSTSKIGLAELAAEMGFSDSGSFQRAFKLWTGHPCGHYRNQR